MVCGSKGERGIFNVWYAMDFNNDLPVTGRA